MVDCCVFASCPPPVRPLLRANFRPASSFFSRNFVPSKHIHGIEILSCAFDVTTAQGVQMCDASVVVSDLLFIPEILWDKVQSVGDFRVFPCFTALKVRTTERRRQEKCPKMQPGPPPKAGTSLGPPCLSPLSRPPLSSEFILPFVSELLLNCSLPELFLHLFELCNRGFS